MSTIFQTTEKIIFNHNTRIIDIIFSLKLLSLLMKSFLFQRNYPEGLSIYSHIDIFSDI